MSILNKYNAAVSALKDLHNELEKIVSLGPTTFGIKVPEDADEVVSMSGNAFGGMGTLMYLDVTIPLIVEMLEAPTDVAMLEYIDEAVKAVKKVQE